MTEEATEGRNAFWKNVSQTFEKNGLYKRLSLELVVMINFNSFEYTTV
jgi:hypothetical protein